MAGKTIAEWEELERKQIFAKYGRKVDEVIFKMPDGQEKDFIIKDQGPAAGILAITEDDEVLIARQFRPGLKEVLNELPGGYVDPEDKNPTEAIARELLEETGYSGKVEQVAVAYDDAYSTMRRYCFVATGCEKIQEAKLDQDEYISLEKMSLADFRDLLRSGKLTDIEVGYLGLDHLNLL